MKHVNVSKHNQEEEVSVKYWKYVHWYLTKIKNSAEKTLQKKVQQGQTEVKLLLPFYLFADLENQLSQRWILTQNGHHDDFQAK